MGEKYDAVLERVRKALPDHIAFSRKVVANKEGLRERDLRLSRHDFNMAADKAAQSVLKSEFAQVMALVVESPGFLHADIEGINHSTIYRELTYVIARSLVDDLREEIEAAHLSQYKGLDAAVLLKTARGALQDLRDLGFPDTADRLDRFESTLTDLEDGGGLLSFGAEIDTVVDMLRQAGKPEQARRLLEEGYFALTYEDRFVPDRSSAPSP